MYGQSQQHPLALTLRVKQLIIINAVLFVIEAITLVWMGNPLLAELFFLQPAAVLEGKVWQLISYMFFHDPKDYLHIVFNLLMLWMFGVQFERRWGSKRFLRFYLICGLAGGLVTFLAGVLLGDEWMYTVTVGASAAILGFIVAFGIIFAKQRIYLMGVVPLTGRQLLWLSVGFELLNLLTRNNVSFTAHAGGMLAGFFIVTDLWRPSLLLNRIRLAKLEAEKRRRRSNLKLVVKSKKDDKGPTLH